MEPSSVQPEVNKARELMQALATAIDRAPNLEASSRAFADRLVAALGTAQLSPNAAADDTDQPPAQCWQQIMDQSIGAGPLLQAVQDLDPIRRWIRAVDFYPEPEHGYFAEHVWGALIAGEQDALVNTNERYIALLIVIEPHTHYPLHAHRIEELYFTITGQAEWSHDGKLWEAVPPGSVFHNASWQPHTMRTGDEPLLAMGLYLPPFGWEGGLVGAS